jgi:hypothetical protein
MIQQLLVTDCLRHNFSTDEFNDLQGQLCALVDDVEPIAERIELSITWMAKNLTSRFLFNIFAIVKAGFTEWNCNLATCDSDEAAEFMEQYLHVLFVTASAENAASISLYEFYMVTNFLLAGYAFVQIIDDRHPGIMPESMDIIRILITCLRQMADVTREAEAVTDPLIIAIAHYLFRGRLIEPRIPRLFNWSMNEQTPFVSTLIIPGRHVDFVCFASFAVPSGRPTLLAHRVGAWRLSLGLRDTLTLSFPDGSIGHSVNNVNIGQTFQLAIIQEHGHVHVFLGASGTLLVSGLIPEIEQCHVEDKARGDIGTVTGVLHHVDVIDVWGTGL